MAMFAEAEKMHLDKQARHVSANLHILKEMELLTHLEQGCHRARRGGLVAMAFYSYAPGRRFDCQPRSGEGGMQKCPCTKILGRFAES